MITDFEETGLRHHILCSGFTLTGEVIPREVFDVAL
jgi:hypothetical protein